MWALRNRVRRPDIRLLAMVILSRAMARLSRAMDRRRADLRKALLVSV